jgi:hypothetical protein
LEEGRRLVRFLAYELDAFGLHLTQAEAKRRIAALAAKLKLLDERTAAHIVIKSTLT